MRKILIATKNKGKLRELKEAFHGMDFEVVSLADIGMNVPDFQETKETFAGNALEKAKNYAEFTGLPCIADDSGLKVDALNGKPGVYSHRFAMSAFHPDPDDDERNHVLLCLMRYVGCEESPASYVCAMTYYDPESKKEIIVEGSCKGIIKGIPKGNNGFSFDKIFYLPDDYTKTMAEITTEEKNKISHRGKAIELMRKSLGSI